MSVRRSLALGALVAVALPAALSAQAATQQPKSATSPAAVALPTAKQVVDAHVKAIGGRDAILRRKSMRNTMTLEMPAMGVKADMEVSTMAPNRVLSKTTLPGLGEMMQGFDGTTAWAIDPMQGARLLQGKELEQMKSQAEFNAELRDPSGYKSMEVLAKTEFEGRPAFKLKLVRLNDDEVTEYYDAEKGLLLGWEQMAQTQMGVVPVTVVRKEYRQMGGLLMPVVTIQKADGREVVLTIVSAEVDVVDPAAFALPAQIKALVPAK